MKNTCILFILVTILLSCEDVIEVDVPNSEPRLNVDAYLNLFTRETPIRLEGGVRLTLSANFFEDEVPLVENAVVFITDLTSGVNYPFTYTGQDGLYLPQNPEDFTDLDTVYELNVTYEDEIYTAEAPFTPVAPISKVTQGTRTLFDEGEIEVIVEFTDDGTRDDYYLYDFGFDQFGTLEDRFFQGKEFRGSSFYGEDDVVPGDTITVKAYGIDEQYFNYFELILEQVEESGPFATLPSTTRGNIINTTDFDNFALGYFLISEADQKQLIIEDLP